LFFLPFRPKLARLLGQFDAQREANALNLNAEQERAMKTNQRFIKSILETAEKSETVMPWARGARRAAFIAKRATQKQGPRKTA
jgi:hypothetical protein